jgi:hypothetical protein
MSRGGSCGSFSISNTNSSSSGGGGGGSSSSKSSNSNSFKISRGDVKIAPDRATNNYFEIRYSLESTQNLPRFYGTQKYIYYCVEKCSPLEPTHKLDRFKESIPV